MRRRELTFITSFAPSSSFSSKFSSYSPQIIQSKRFTPAVMIVRKPRSPCSANLNNNSSATELDSEQVIQKTLQSIRASPIVLCIRMDDPQQAINAASAAIRGGIICVEVAMTTPIAATIIRRLTQTYPHAIIGAGTVLTNDDLNSAANAGARFAFSPITDVNIIKACHRRSILAVPGAATPTECYNAYNAGAKLVKVFPINLYGGIDFVKTMKGPLAHIPLLPTSGVKYDSLSDYLSQSNVLAVGASRQILPKDALATEDWQTITEIAKKWAQVGQNHVQE